MFTVPQLAACGSRLGGEGVRLCILRLLALDEREKRGLGDRKGMKVQRRPQEPRTAAVDSGPDYLRVEFRTRLGFVDDGEFALERPTRVIHVRSASRVGDSDLGKDRRRVEELRKALGGRLASP